MTPMRSCSPPVGQCAVDPRVIAAYRSSFGTGDFRTQEEHGAEILAVPLPPPLVELGGRAVASLDPAPLYARVDLLRVDAERVGVIELELIEPALYLRCDPEAPRRFAVAFDAWMRATR